MYHFILFFYPKMTMCLNWSHQPSLKRQDVWILCTVCFSNKAGGSPWMSETSLAQSTQFESWTSLTYHAFWSVAESSKHIFWLEPLNTLFNEKTLNAELVLVLFQTFGLSKQKLMNFNGNMNPHGDQDEKDTLENTVWNDVNHVTESYSLSSGQSAFCSASSTVQY